MHDSPLSPPTETRGLRAWTWVLTANLGEGLPYAIVNITLVALLADMQLGSGTITLATSLLALPWAWKALWSPVVDTVATKRRWLLAMQLLTGAALAVAALAAGHGTAAAAALLAAAGVAAVASATYDVACDGYYMLALPPGGQRFFVGVRTMAYRLGMLLASGGVVALAGRTSWSAALMAAAGLCAALWALHTWLLPAVEAVPAATRPRSGGLRALVAPFGQFVREHTGRGGDLGFMLLFLFTYRLGEAFLSKVTILFLKAPVAQGGLGLDNADYGLVYGTAGIVALMAGGIAGGVVASRYGLRRCMLPMVAALNVPDLVYVWLASAQPPSLAAAGACVAFEQLGYGFGLTAYTVYLLECADGEFKTSNYAFLTALMAIAMTLPSTLSGYALQWMGGYTSFFVLACVLTLPSFGMAAWYVARTRRTARSGSPAA